MAEGHTLGERADSFLPKEPRFVLGTLKLWMFPLAKWVPGGIMWIDRGSEHAEDHQLECSSSCVCMTVVPLGLGMVVRACHIVSKAGLYLLYAFSTFILNLFFTNLY